MPPVVTAVNLKDAILLSHSLCQVPERGNGVRKRRTARGLRIGRADDGGTPKQSGADYPVER
jgi:ribosomal protein S6E (S10)